MIINNLLNHNKITKNTDQLHYTYIYQYKIHIKCGSPLYKSAARFPFPFSVPISVSIPLVLPLLFLLTSVVSRRIR